MYYAYINNSCLGPSLEQLFTVKSNKNIFVYSNTCIQKIYITKGILLCVVVFCFFVVGVLEFISGKFVRAIANW